MAPSVAQFHPVDGATREVPTLDPVPGGLLYPIALTAGRALAQSERFLLKKCANQVCSRVFVDLTRNHSRRWCTMSVCGNPAKARAYYRRHLASG